MDEQVVLIKRFVYDSIYNNIEQFDTLISNAD